MLKNKPCPIIAEIGVNHEGSFEAAKRMIALAAGAGADYVKFQSYTVERFIAASQPERRARVSKFALSERDYIALKTVADSVHIGMLSTPVTEDWVDKLLPLCPAFKIASGDIDFKPVIEKAAKTGKPLIVSTGAATLEEIDRAVKWIEEIVGRDQLKNHLTLMHCVSSYPTPIEQANILSIPFLKKRYGLPVGYSNHVIGMNACLGAVALGADMIEVHFTEKKEGRSFRDHALSFDADDLAYFIKAADDIKKSLGFFDKAPQLCESGDIPALRKGIIAAKNLKKGDILMEEDVLFARPASEFFSHETNLVVGRTLKEDIPQGYTIPRKAL